MFDQITENDADVEDNKGIIQTLQIPNQQSQFQFNYGSDGVIGFGP